MTPENARGVSVYVIDPTPPPSCIWIRLPGPQKRSARRYIQTSPLSRTYFMFALFFFGCIGFSKHMFDLILASIRCLIVYEHMFDWIGDCDEIS